MRIAINRMAEMGKLTGVGHYVRELRRCLLPQLSAGEVLTAFPTGWRWWTRWSIRRLGQLARGGEREPSATFAVGPDRPTFRQRALCQARRCYDVFIEELLCGEVSGRDFDLYHEPNFIPQPGLELPTITTLCDLSPLLHPQ
ncbi:MAG: hypothetical protein WAQ28_15880, partial [Bacteroidia bacterium]